MFVFVYIRLRNEMTDYVCVNACVCVCVSAHVCTRVYTCIRAYVNFSGSACVGASALT